MPMVCTLTDINTGFGEIFTAAKTVYFDYLPACRVGDLYTAHNDHPVGPVIEGSPTVITEYALQVRLGDMCQCGHVMLSKHPMIWVGP
jgi:hypothetical protein